MQNIGKLWTKADSRVVATLKTGQSDDIQLPHDKLPG